ncbi:MAG: hypothetical protein L0H24_00140 [Microlunatus sp.]|nr:hypothetical protein [Microlunatus sp.]
MTESTCPTVLVDLDVLIAPSEEDHVAEAIRSSVSHAVPEPTYSLGPPTWGDPLADDDLVRQWRIEQEDRPLADRRVRRITMYVEGADVADRLDEISRAAVEAVCPNARKDDALIGSGESVPVVADEFPWSSATRIVTGPDDE